MRPICIVSPADVSSQMHMCNVYILELMLWLLCGP